MLVMFLVYLNGVWDAFAGGAMLFYLRFDRDLPLPHWALWIEEPDRRNRAARLLFVGLVFMWGGLRLLYAQCLFGYYYYVVDVPVPLACDSASVVWSYILECILCAGGALVGRMHEGRALMVCLMCTWFMWLILWERVTAAPVSTPTTMEWPHEASRF